MKFIIKAGAEQHDVEVPDTATIGELKEAIFAKSNVEPPNQKLLGKPNLQSAPHDALLISLGFKTGTAVNRVMMIGASTADQQKATVAEAGNDKHEGAVKKIFASSPRKLWLTSIYTCLLCDPYVNSELAKEVLVPTLLSVDGVLNRLNPHGPLVGPSAAMTVPKFVRSSVVRHADFPKKVMENVFTTVHMVSALRRAHGVFRDCIELAMRATSTANPKLVHTVATFCVSKIEKLPIHEYLLIPSGWHGRQNKNVVFLIISREQEEEEFQVVVVNRGADGSQYHPRWQTVDKEMGCPLLTLNHVKQRKLMDKAFWILLLSLWMRAENDPENKSEFIRCEVFYEVFLPWLTEQTGERKASENNEAESASHLRELVLERYSRKGTPSNAEIMDRNIIKITPTEDLNVNYTAYLSLKGSTFPRTSSLTKSAVTAFCWLVDAYSENSVSAKQMKQFKFAMKLETYLLASEGLLRSGRKLCPLTPGSVASGDLPPPDVQEKKRYRTETDTQEIMNLASRLDTLTEMGVENPDGNFFTVADIEATAVTEGVMLAGADHVLLRKDHFKEKLVVVYVGAMINDEPPRFSKVLAEAAPKFLSYSKCKVEMLFISLDDTREAYDRHCAIFPFPRAMFPALKLANSLGIPLDIAPKLFVFNQDGILLCQNGVKALSADPDLEGFPTDNKWIDFEPLNFTDTKLLSIGTGMISHHVQKRLKKSELSTEEAGKLVELMDAVTDVAQRMPRAQRASLYSTTLSAETVALASSTEPEVQPGDPSAKDTQHISNSILLNTSLNTSVSEGIALSPTGFTNAELLPYVTTARYLGKPFSPVVPLLKSVHSWQRATSYSSLHLLLRDASSTLKVLWARAGNSSTSSRVAEQMHIIELITWTVVHLLPVPTRAVTMNSIPDDEARVVSSFYTNDHFSPVEGVADLQNPDANKDMQLDILTDLFQLSLSLANAWQAVETPQRNFDAERSLTAMHLLAVFDAVARQQSGSSKCEILSQLLNANGGFFLSTSLAVQQVSFESVSAFFELSRPELLPIRSALVRYIRDISTQFREELFDFPMPSTTLMEVRRGSPSMLFLRRYLELSGISLLGDDDNLANAAQSSDMERLVNCFCAVKPPAFITKHPEFFLLRDMVFLTKVLGTMETRDAYLLHRRKEMDGFASWILSFEESTPGRHMSAMWRTNPKAPTWEPMLVRGQDMDIADIRVRGFGGRELLYGQGMVLNSPVDVSRIMETAHPTEDDILHCKKVYAFSSFNPEEAEAFLSFLTTPYLRIPLILDFFASGDRSTHLFVKEVQDALRSVLFEPASYAPSWSSVEDVTNIQIPLERSAFSGVSLATQSYLGTPFGLLLNELAKGPHAVLEPLRSLLVQATMIGRSSVYSAHAAFVLFLIEVVCDVLSYCHFACDMDAVPAISKAIIREDSQRLLEYMEHTAYHWLGEWIAESEANDDTPTQCVVRSCCSVVDRALWKAAMSRGKDEEATAEITKRVHLLHLLQSCAFVRSHHGFGMGLQRTQLTAQSGDDVLTPEQSLVRFLQAHGLRIPNINSAQLLEQVKKLMLCGGRRRAVFLQISRGTSKDSVRLPNLFRDSPKSAEEAKVQKLPPCDVFENRVFYYLLDSYMEMLNVLREMPRKHLSTIMDGVVTVVLRQPCASPPALTTEAQWTLGLSSDILVGPPHSGLVFHLQTGELFWRKKGIVPVPDSMSHFTDYEDILGKELRQCGEIMRHQHRQWVHVVGTPYDLMEWSAPMLEKNECGERCPSVIGGDWPESMATAAVWEGVVFDRPVERSDLWAVRSELWAINFLQTVYYANWYSQPVVVPLAMARDEAASSDEEVKKMRFLLNDAPQYPDHPEQSTWKEIVVYKYPQVYLEVFNLVPHARKMYRSLTFTTNQRLSLHSLKLQHRGVSEEYAQQLVFMAGDPTTRVEKETTLEIHRYNERIKGREVYLPPRLLQGVVPGTLLEHFSFWQGEDEIIRGYNVEKKKERCNAVTNGEEEDPGATDAFENRHNFSVEVFLKGGKAFIVRREDNHYTPVFEEDEVYSTSSEFSTSEWKTNIALLRSAIRERHEVCAKILENFHGDCKAALEWALDPKSNTEKEAIRAAITPARHFDPTITETTGATFLCLRPDDRVLVNLRSCPSLHHLFSLLCGLEDASHILCWASPSNSSSDAALATRIDEEMEDLFSIQTIEMPRLRARFLVQRDAGVSGSPLHFFLAEYPGWRVAQPEDLHTHSLEKLYELRETFQQSLVLCNAIHEVAVMVPNHVYAPVKLIEDPFNPYLCFDRSDFSWQVVPSPFYLYSLHSCGSIVVPQSLSASLYLAALQCATKHYSDSITTLEACYTDTVFTQEEMFMLDAFQFTQTDSYPDAHAVRLKVSHALHQSPNKYEWMTLQDEMDHYLCKLPHISSDCRLHLTEVMDLIKRCSSPSSLIRAQLKLHAARRQKPGTEADFTLDAPSVSPVGMCWDRLFLQPWRRIESQKLQHVTFLMPTNLEKVEGILGIVYRDWLLADEESGANSRLGFFFLYHLRIGGLKIEVEGEDYSTTFTSLMSRWFHLRHARWGREHTLKGESNAEPSWCATVLQLMELYPNAGWPKSNLQREAFALRRGINLTEQPARMDAMPGDQLLQRSSLPILQMFATVADITKRLFTGASPQQSKVLEDVRSQRREFFDRLNSTKRVVRVPLGVPEHLIGRTQHLNTSLDKVTLSQHLNVIETEPYRKESGRALPSGTLELGSHETLAALCRKPLLGVETLRAFVGVCAGQQDAQEEDRNDDEQQATVTLPFNLKAHPLASSSIARSMLERLETDFVHYSSQEREKRKSHSKSFDLSCLSTGVLEDLFLGDTGEKVETAFRAATSELDAAIVALRALRQRDQDAVALISKAILKTANSVETVAMTSPEKQPTFILHRLKLFHRDRMPLRMEWLCGGLLSTELQSEVSTQNPFHGPVEHLRNQISLLMLLSNRSHLAMQVVERIQQISLFLNFCRLLRGVSEDDQRKVLAERARGLHTYFALEISPAQLEELLHAIADCSHLGSPLPQLPEYARKLLSSRLHHLTSSARELLCAERHYIEKGSGKKDVEEGSCHGDAYHLDPRFLLMEFLFNIMLRRRQVEMTRWFVEELRNGRSRVQQMIMGQGKTSVVAPLLALILADGKQLVTQVMPTALVEQTRAVLRRCFGVVIVKHVFTLQFDRNRGSDSSSGGLEVEALLSKLERAVTDRAVIVAAPECLKSLFLKFVEQLHLLESTPPPKLTDKDARSVTLVTREQERQVIHARIVDGIAPILALWRDGVLLMDEVDVLLHPLRSELNFPVGQKNPIDLSGVRWSFPIHLLDLVCDFRITGRKVKATVNSMSDALLYAEVQYKKSRSVREHSTQLAAFSDSTYVPPDMEDLSCYYHSLIASFRAVVAKGLEEHALQKEPHLAILDLHFYKTEMLPLLMTWSQLWVFEELHTYLSKNHMQCTPLWMKFHEMQMLTHPLLLCPDKVNASNEAAIAELVQQTPSYGIQLLQLTHDWLHRLLPHVLAKINRVSYGVLQPRDLNRFTKETIDSMPLSRKFSAVPFVAKDVPSTSSEFAHPDVAIGLTILAFRYEGLRLQDTKLLLQELKKDFSEQLGPKEQRPAALLYQEWVRRGAAVLAVREAVARGAAPVLQRGNEENALSRTATSLTTELLEVPPLSQVQTTDTFQIRSLHRVLRFIPDVIYHYLSFHVFPRIMLFHQLKISACGHELGSSILFGRRLGFSGTPSNLLPLDLGACEYESGSDARVLSVLTNPDVVTAEIIEEDWTPWKVLDKITAAIPSFYALIDAGALITNMNNSDVATYLLARLPPYLFDGVVYLDDRDQQVVLQRSNRTAVPVAQCGIPISRRFTFFDQVHTTGTDVKQVASANAVMTLSKDLTFRDYAQAAYRMRGIGDGQRLCLYLTPEVVSRMTKMLSLPPVGVEAASGQNFLSGDILRDVPAWLMLNSMKIESLQLLKLSMQELSNVWRKKAYHFFLSDSLSAIQNPQVFTSLRRAAMFRVDRKDVGTTAHPIRWWTGKELRQPTLEQLCLSIQEFREPVGYPVPVTIDPPRDFQVHVEEFLAHRPALLADADDNGDDDAITAEVRRRLQFFADEGAAKHQTEQLVDPYHDLTLNAEMVHEQEAEEEQQQEAEVEEQRVSYYSRDDETLIPWMLSSLKSSGFHPDATVTPTNGSCFYQVRQFSVHRKPPAAKLVNILPNYLLSDNYFRLHWGGAGDRRLKNATLFLEWTPFCPTTGKWAPKPCYGLVSLAEAESLRWLLHQKAPSPDPVSGVPLTHSMTLRLVRSGRSVSTLEDLETEGRSELACETLLFRFINSEMFFTEDQLNVLSKQVLGAVPPESRRSFFNDCLRCRRRQTQHWEDTPVARLFYTAEDEPYRRHLSCLLALRTNFEGLIEKVMEVHIDQFQGKEPEPKRLIESSEFDAAMEQFSCAVMSMQTTNSDESDGSLRISLVATLLKEHFASPTRVFTVQELEETLSFALWRLQIQKLEAQETDAAKTEAYQLRAMPRTCVLSDMARVTLAQLHEILPWVNPSFFFNKLEEHCSTLQEKNACWDCPACTLRNQTGFGSCVVCGTLRPHSPGEEKNEEDSPWACACCTFINSSRKQPVCSMCLSPNPQILQSPSEAGANGLPVDRNLCPDGYWVCTVEDGGCTKLNPLTEFYCSACNKGRPGLAHLRF